jgi:hypothetical protein
MNWLVIQCGSLKGERMEKLGGRYLLRIFTFNLLFKLNILAESITLTFWIVNLDITGFGEGFIAKFIIYVKKSGP